MYAYGIFVVVLQHHVITDGKSFKHYVDRGFTKSTMIPSTSHLLMVVSDTNRSNSGVAMFMAPDNRSYLAVPFLDEE